MAHSSKSRSELGTKTGNQVPYFHHEYVPDVQVYYLLPRHWGHTVLCAKIWNLLVGGIWGLMSLGCFLSVLEAMRHRGFGGLGAKYELRPPHILPKKWPLRGGPKWVGEGWRASWSHIHSAGASPASCSGCCNLVHGVTAWLRVARSNLSGAATLWTRLWCHLVWRPL